MSICPTDLRQHYRNGRLLPFIGAGVSTSVHWTDGSGAHKRGPSWEELVNQAAKKLGFDDPRLLRVRGGDLQILEYFGIKRHGEFAGLANWLAREMNPPDGDYETQGFIRSWPSLRIANSFTRQITTISWSGRCDFTGASAIPLLWRPI